jgi:hypothetical protein
VEKWKKWKSEFEVDKYAVPLRHVGMFCASEPFRLGAEPAD